MVSSTLIVALAGLSTFAQAAPIISKRGSSKLGYAFGKCNQAKIDMFSPAPGCWGYDWEARADDQGAMYKLPGGCEFVPMIHDDSDMFVNAWTGGDAQKAIDAGSKHLLSFNEPDHCGPSDQGGTCIPVDRAVAKHKELMGPFCGKDIKIGAPAVTNGGEENKGLKYLQNFLDKCSDCQIDFINIHWQSEGDCPVSTFTDHVKAAHDQTGKPVWVTEFQAPKASADPVKFMKDATSWLEQQDYVKRYAYWSVDAKLTNGNALNDLGAAYAGI